MLSSRLMAPSFLAAALTLLGAGQGLAQEAAATPPTAPTAPDAQDAPTAPDAPEQPPAPSPTLEEFEALKNEVAALREEVAAQAEEEVSDGAGEQLFERTLDVYGFFDLTLGRTFINDANIVNDLLPEALSFSMANLNVYLSSRMTETWSALVELRFTTLPNGLETWSGGYSRTDTNVTNPSDSKSFALGGVSIERAEVTWQPWDYLAVTAGRFLTPFGIWNVDHGSPVILTVSVPYIMINQTVPLAQTGLQIHGRFFPAKDNFLDYALTLSNSRGAFESTLDVSDNKALGLRLHYAYEGDDARVALGGYGYWGTSEQMTKNITFNEEVLEVSEETLSSYTELTGCLDFLLELYGVRLQAEYARGLVTYGERPLRTIPIVELDAAGQYVPDHVRYDAYVLLAYTLPLSHWLADVKIIPYVVGDHSVPDDSLEDEKSWLVRYGLNVQPNSFVAIKVEGSTWWVPDSPYLPEENYGVAGQIAVSF